MANVEVQGNTVTISAMTMSSKYSTCVLLNNINCPWWLLEIEMLLDNAEALEIVKGTEPKPAGGANIRCTDRSNT